MEELCAGGGVRARNALALHLEAERPSQLLQLGVATGTAGPVWTGNWHISHLLPLCCLDTVFSLTIETWAEGAILVPELEKERPSSSFGRGTAVEASSLGLVNQVLDGAALKLMEAGLGSPRIKPLCLLFCGASGWKERERAGPVLSAAGHCTSLPAWEGHGELEKLFCSEPGAGI